MTAQITARIKSADVDDTILRAGPAPGQSIGDKESKNCQCYA